MAKSQIPSKPELLVAMVTRMIEGDEMHKSENPLPAKVRKAIEDALATLDPVYRRLLQSKVDYLELRQQFVEARKATLKVVRSARDAVYGLYSRVDKTIGDYGLVNPKIGRRSRKEVKSDGSKPASNAA